MRKPIAVCAALLLGMAGAALPALSASADELQPETSTTTTTTDTTPEGGTIEEPGQETGETEDGTKEGTGTEGGDQEGTGTEGGDQEGAGDPSLSTTGPGSGGPTPNTHPEEPKYVHEIGLYIYPLVDPSKGPGWENSGRQTFCGKKHGDDWFTASKCAPPKDVCGVDWGYQQDKVKIKEGEQYTFPPVIDRSTGEGAFGPELIDSKHGSLSELGVHIPDCDKPVHEVPPPHFADNCPTGPGSYTLEVPTATGVDYSVTDNKQGLVTVTATPKAGYVFGPNVKTTYWEYHYTNDECPPVKDATASVTTKPATCEAPGTAEFSVTNAEWVDPADTTDGSRIARALPGHAFADGSTETTVTYELQKKLSGAVCGELPTLSKTDPPTLAYTGSTDTPWLGAAGLALLAIGTIAAIGAARRNALS